MSEAKYGEILSTVAGGADLSESEARGIFTRLMDGELSEVQIAALLGALAVKGAVASELAGAAMAMREHAVRIDVGDLDVIDTCGTGGTGLSTFNISTASALVAAGAGAKVAKHGNVTNTRASGSANVLEVLGVNLAPPASVVARCIEEAGVGFCYARACHPAMKYAAPVRKQLPIRTIFNLLGPMTNPAGAKRQVMGLCDAGEIELIAEALGRLGAVRAWVVSAEDGLDEISITEPTRIAEWHDGKVATRVIQPEDFGLPRATMDDLLVDSPQASAEVIHAILNGAANPPARNIVLLNAAAALLVADRAADLAEGIQQAEKSIDSGAAKTALEKLVALSNESAD